MMDLDANLSCDDFFPTDSSTDSSKTNGKNYPLRRGTLNEAQSKPSPNGSELNCPSMILSSSSSSSIGSEFFNQDCRQQNLSKAFPPNIGYEVALAKSILQQFSSISGDNLFDHLSDIIKRVIDERPPNVIDFFEEFSRNVREQKLHLPERFPPDGVYQENRLYKIAKKQLMSMKLPSTTNATETLSPDEELEEERTNAEDLQLELKQKSQDRFSIFYDRVQHLQFYWNQCGFSITPEDIFQLACAMNRLQTHPSIRQCRFWGKMNGLRASYYIVEALLTNDEIDSRYMQMQKEILEGQWTMPEITIKLPSPIGPELTPGAMGWDNYPIDELQKMRPQADPIPQVKVEELFDIPPEPIGRGVNRFSYFVVNSLSDEWIELPICTPKQIRISRQIKKFLTGDLEADVVSYPCFPGKEKHYLRTMIARITASTVIAPKGFYRRMTTSEKRLFDGLIDNEADEEDDESETEDENDNDTIPGEGEEESLQGIPDNDVVLLKNEKYKPLPLANLNLVSQWVHVRPNILPQGRVVWFDEEKAKLDRQKEIKRLEKLRKAEEMGLEEDEGSVENESSEEEESLGEEEEEDEIVPLQELGPAILTSCSMDQYQEVSVAWVGRYTSNYTIRNERLLLMRSNIWPGAYTFTFDRMCESIYLGWGHKYMARNIAWQHLPPFADEFPHNAVDFIETNDPTVEMEDAYYQSLLKRDLQILNLDENLSDYDNESDGDDDEDDDDEEEEE